MSSQKYRKGSSVRPKRWKNVLDLYDDGCYSAIWGNYDNSKNRVLGVRWNGNYGKDLGYPNMAGHPLWYVEPSFLTKSLLLNLLKQVVSSKLENRKDYIKNIALAIKEYDNR